MPISLVRAPLPEMLGPWLNGGGPIGGFKIARKNGPSFGVRICGQETLKAEMKDLKNQRADLRKQIRLNAVKAKNAAKRKKRLVQASRVFVSLLLHNWSEQVFLVNFEFFKGGKDFVQSRSRHPCESQGGGGRTYSSYYIYGSCS